MARPRLIHGDLDSAMDLLAAPFNAAGLRFDSQNAQLDLSRALRIAVG